MQIFHLGGGEDTRRQKFEVELRGRREPWRKKDQEIRHLGQARKGKLAVSKQGT